MAGVPRSGRSVQRRVCTALSAIMVTSHKYMEGRAPASPRFNGQKARGPHRQDGCATDCGVLGNYLEKRFGRRRSGALQFPSWRDTLRRVPNFRRDAPCIEGGAELAQLLEFT